jgi:rubrerythrin
LQRREIRGILRTINQRKVAEMNNEDLTLRDAIQIAKAAEQKAADLYADAAHQTPNPLAQELFEKLAEFERHHYDKLVRLEKSLREEGAFIEYEGREMDFPTSGEVKSIEEPDRKSAMAIITMAIDIEQEAEKRYATLAKQTSDPDGRSMFEQLAKEEHSHYLILSDAYWSLNDRGVWVVPK